jgi:LPS-assembly lipoprotein
MWWREARTSFGRAARVAIALASAGVAGGCFQPLYGEGTLPGSSNVRDALSSVEVQHIEASAGSSDAKLAVQIRNDLMFNFTGGGAPNSAAYRLKVRVSGSRVTIVVGAAALPTAENYGMNATYTLTEIATNKDVVTGRATATVSYDPSGQQRFARLSALHDGERRAAKVIAENITTRLASYFISGS